MKAMRQIARAYNSGLLNPDHLEAVIAMQAVQAERANAASPVNGDLEGHVQFARWAFVQQAEADRLRRDQAEYDIRRAVWPMLKKAVNRGASPGAIRAIAHDINADRGRTLTEQQVDDAVATTIRDFGRQVRRGR